MESSIKKGHIQKWIIKQRKDLLEHAGEGDLEMDKFMWTLLLLSSLEEWVWDQG